VDIVVRPIEEAERDPWIRAAEAIFGTPHPSDEHLAMERSVHELERAWGAFDGDALVGTTGSYPFSMIVPGGADVATAGVTMVSVAPSHRRRGILTEMMRAQLDDLVARGEPLAALNASESLIYERFGFGSAVDTATYEIDKRASAFRTPLDDQGSFEIVGRDEAHGVVADIYERSRATRNGSISRTDAWWRVVLGPIDNWRGGGDLSVVVHRSPTGEPDGYAFYRFEMRLEHGIQVGTVVIGDLVGVSPDVEAAMWRFLLDIDLATTAVAHWRPVDDPIRWRLLEPRQLRTIERPDMLWVRLVDVGEALSLRAYASDDSVVLEITDGFLPVNEGCYRIDGSSGTVERVDDVEPDLTLDVCTLGATYLGGVSFATLAAAGRIAQHQPGALKRADALFVTPFAPHCTTRF
jgi:predicted acetyltransferase